MAEHLIFEFKYAYKDSSEGITLPVTLFYGGIQIRTEAKVDCGAECCVFSHEDGLDLGIDIPSGIPKLMDQ